MFFYLLLSFYLIYIDSIADNLLNLKKIHSYILLSKQILSVSQHFTVNMYKFVILLICCFPIQPGNGRAYDILPKCESVAHLHGCNCISHETLLLYSSSQEPLKCPPEFIQDSHTCRRNITHRSPTCTKPLRMVHPWGQEECVCRLYNYVYVK